MAIPTVETVLYELHKLGLHDTLLHPSMFDAFAAWLSNPNNYPTGGELDETTAKVKYTEFMAGIHDLVSPHFSFGCTPPDGWRPDRFDTPLEFQEGEWARDACSGWPQRLTIDHLAAKVSKANTLPYVPTHFCYNGLLGIGDVLTQGMLPMDPSLKPPYIQKTLECLMEYYQRFGRFVKLNKFTVARLWVLHRFHETARMHQEPHDPRFTSMKSG
jgi:hypothetical protein